MLSSFRISRILVVGMMLPVLAGLKGLALAQSAWPGIALPKEVQVFDITAQMTVNGLPMRVQGFVSTTKPAQLANWFRQDLGNPLIENKLAEKLILGRAHGEHYLTVQLEPAGTGTRGLIATTHLKAAYDRRLETQAAIDHWQSRLPSGSRVISQMTSEDRGKLAQHLVAINNHSTDLNLERIKSLMREDGFALQYEATADSKGTSRTTGAIATGKTLFFTGLGKEAMAVIYSKDSGSTTIVLNTVTLMDRLK